MSGLSSFLKENAITSTKRQGQSQDLTSSPQSNITTPTTTKKEASQNNGGFFGGLGYLGQKASLGFLSSIEGIWDYTAGGIAKLFGADDWAEQQIATDWTNYNAADEWYNPSEGWKIAGDVAGGIGTSLPSMLGAAAGAAIIYFSGGSLTSVGAKLIVSSLSAGIAGFGAAGNATKEAYRETGQLTGKEFGYGALSGATEAAIELASAGISKGSGRIVNELAKKAAKETTETVAKTGAKTVLKQLGEDFAQEAIEEGLAEILSPVYQQLTYNPDAKNATPEEIAYAALVGGLSGMIMSGSRIGINATVNTTDNYLSGKNAQKNGTTAGIIESGKTLAEVEAENDTGIEAFQSVRDTYNKLTESLKKHNGISTDTDLENRLKSGNLTFNTKDLMCLGKLKKANTIARLQPFIERSAQGLILNPEGAAQRYSAFGMKDANGKPINVTADEILSGINASLIEKAKKGEISKEDSKTLARQMRKALSDNSVLATLAVAEATGKIMVDTRKIAESIARGENLANTADLNRLIEKGKPEEMQALGRALGITDWATVTQEELRARVAQLNQSGGLSELAEQSKRMRRALEQGAENAKPLPHILRKNMEDGVYRYASEDSSVNMAILKEGDRYRLYDYDGDNISRELTVKDVNKVLNDFWTKGKTTTAESMQSTEQTDTAKQTAAIDAYARENIPEYRSMSEPNKAAVRMTIRQAQANGVSAEDTLLIATVAAKSGLNIVFDAQMALGDGSISGNTIYINPNNTRERTYEVILGHEMFHKIFAEGGKKAMNLYTKAKELVDSEKAEIVEKKYKDFYKKQKVASSVAQAIAQEEVAAAGVEEVFKSKEAWEYILGEEPTFADKVLSFFRKSARDYSSIQGLSSQARKFLRQYKKLFDSISESNKGNNSLSIALEGAQKTFAEQIDDVLNGVHNPKHDLYIAQTPSVLVDLNFADKPLLMRNSKVREILDKHPEMTVDLIKKIPDIIKDPVLILKSKTHPKESVVIISDIITSKGEIIVPIWVNQEGNYIDVEVGEVVDKTNFVASAYGRSITTLLDYANSNDGFLYENPDKKRVRNLIARSGLQLSTPLKISNSEISISDSKQKINPSDENSSKKPPKKRFALTDEAYLAAIESGDMDTAQKMVDEAAKEAGYTVKAYHGTKNEFNSFDKSKIGSGVTMFASQGSGFYFTEKKSVATKYANGGKVLSSFLEANNLFEFIDKKNQNANRLLDEFARLNGASFDVNQYANFVNFEKRTGAVLSRIVGDKGKDFTAFLQDKGFDGILYTSYDYDTGSSNKTYVVFEPEQIKSADPVTYDDNGNVIPLSERFNASNPDIRFALNDNKDIANYTEKQYNDYGWARANEILNAGQNKDYRTKFAEAINGSKAFDKTSSDEWMIPVSDINDSTAQGINNVIVYAKGTIGKPIITRVLTIDAYDETTLSKIREELYVSERQGISAKTGGLFQIYSPTDYGYQQYKQRTGNRPSQNNNQLGAERGAGSRTTQKATGGIQSPYLKVVHTFTDVTGKKRNVVKVSNNQYMIEGDTRSKYQPTIEATVKAENNRIFERYARKHDKTVSFVRAKYAVDNDFLKNFRYALPLDEDLDAIFGGINTEADADGASFDIDAVLERGIPRKPGASDLTIGEMKKTIANNTHYQVYSKTKALEVISKMSGSSDLSLKTREKLADALWQGFNDCTDVESRQTFARDMAEYIVATMVTEAKVANPDVMEAQERLSYLAPYIGRISFHPEYLSEIRHIADKAGLKKILGRWGYKGRKGTSRVPMDIFAVDIAREMPGMSELENMHPVEAFMELNAMYENAKNDVKDKWISAYLEATDEEMLSLVSGIESDIMSAFETEGDKSKFAKLVEEKIGYYSTQAQFWKAEHDKIKGRDRILGLLMSKAQRMKDLKLGTFANATQIDSEIFKNSIEKLAKIQFRGNFNQTGTRDILSELKQWYRKDNSLLEYVDDSNTGLYVQSIADMLEVLSQGDKKFTTQELMTLYDVMSYFVKFVENYGKVFRNGKMIEALPEAQRYISIAEANQNVKVGLFAKVSGSWYAEMFNDPAALVRRMDYYERGFYTEMFEDLRNAAVDAEVAEMRIMRGYDEFLQDNKKYIEKASEELVEYRGRKIPKLQLIDLYMTMKRKHSWAGIALNGFTFKNLEGKTERVPGFVTDERISQTDLEAAIKEQQAEMAKHFTEADRQYMSLLEKGYNEDARKLKADRDLQRLGFTNATSDYYYPIRRAYTAQNVDKSDAQAEYDRVTNSSFNKDTVKGAKQEIAIESADSRFRRHIHAVCQYSYLSPAVETFNRLYNMDTSGNKNRPISVRTASENVWTKGNKYFVNLISDIQGIPRGSTEGMAALSFIRGSYAKFQLGANPKVWLTQLSSLFASSSILDADSITRGVALSAEGIDQYCPLAELRSYDNTAAMAQAVIDKQGKAKSKAGRVMGKVNKFSDALMIPIGKMDRFVLCRLFGACQVQVEKNGGAKVGTEANKIEAGKLLKKVILETQQNSIATERSAAMRSGNEFLRTVTMFTADSMKVMGRVVDAFGEISVLRAKLKTATDANIKADLESRLKNAIRNARKSTGALVLSAIFMASIAQLFRHIYDKEQKEDESVAETMIVDAVGNLFGGLPLIKDVYARIFEGYGFDNYAYSAINDLLDSTKNLFDTAGNIISGSASSQDVANGIKNLSYSIGQLTGLPVRNVYNVFYGLTKRFSPETAYKIDNAFYVKNYKNDFYKAIENDDAEMASFILGLLYNERLGTDMSESVHNELYSLSASGYKVIPKAAPKSITIDGEEYELTDVEQEAVRGSYSESQDSLEKLFATAKYQQLTDEKKTEAIKYVYDLHYGIALQNVLGIDGSNSVLISSVVGVDNLALLYVDTKGLTSDTDKSGNTISGSKRTKVVKAINKLNIPKMQKLILICASGYAIKDGDIKGVSADSAKKQLLRYILSLKGASKEQKAELAKMCGFEVKNGKIITKNTSLSK